MWRQDKILHHFGRIQTERLHENGLDDNIKGSVVVSASVDCSNLLANMFDIIQAIWNEPLKSLGAQKPFFTFSWTEGSFFHELFQYWSVNENPLKV